MMKKLLFSQKQSFFAMLLVMVLGVAGFGKATAATPIQLNQELTISFSNNDAVYSYRAAEAGMLYVEVTPYSTASEFLFYDEACTDPVPEAGAREERMNPGQSSTMICSFQVTAGTTYYFSWAWNTILDPVKVLLTMQTGAVAPRVVMVYPDCNPSNPTTYNLSNAPELQLMFNPGSTTFEKAELQYTDANNESKTFILDYYQIDFDKSWRVNIQSAFAQISVKAGSEFKVVLYDVKADGVAVEGNYTQNGNVVLPYIFMPQTFATQWSWPAKFESYWPEGDQAGIAWIKFSGPLKPLDQQTSMEYGLYNGNDIESENGMTPMNLPKSKITYDENSYTLYIDFTGIMRSGTEPVMTFRMSHMDDANGFPFVYDGQNQIWVEFDFEAMEEITISYELTPGSGNIANTNEIELWIANDTFDHLTIEGFEFNCGQQSVTVDIANCTQTPDTADPNYTLIYIPVPDVAKTAENVTMTAIVNSLDGYNYDGRITASYTGSGTGGSGVNAIGSENGKVTIYNLQGVKVLGGANAADLKNLPKGVYIVNGKKVKN